MTDLELIFLEEQEEAERIEYIVAMTAKAAYYALLAEIDAVWAVVCTADTDVTSYITDECVDSETAESAVYESLEYWQLMCASAANAAGSRAEEQGYNINKILGRSIY